MRTLKTLEALADRLAQIVPLLLTALLTSATLMAVGEGIEWLEGA